MAKMALELLSALKVFSSDFLPRGKGDQWATYVSCSKCPLSKGLALFTKTWIPPCIGDELNLSVRALFTESLQISPVAEPLE